MVGQITKSGYDHLIFALTSPKMTSAAQTLSFGLNYNLIKGLGAFLSRYSRKRWQLSRVLHVRRVFWVSDWGLLWRLGELG